MKSWSRSSTAIPAKISVFVKNPMLNRDSRYERHAKTFVTCVTMIAVRQAVVACIYRWSEGGSMIPQVHPPCPSTQKKLNMQAVASIGPRNRYARAINEKFNKRSVIFLGACFMMPGG